ncbi:MAG: UvrD-helicase domain-containing protein [Prevotella sp.]|nr:UvrD-helicase domain-containing protein [Prevotella sp.]
MQKPLVVYKASAGSGKTFTLATEYIKLLVHNPLNYRSILAVTFTNKATEEMKMRILSQLYGIWKQLPDSDSYAQKVQEETNLPMETIRQRSGEALHLLLHNYTGFRVQTIDAFFQSVLRNLARELELTANLRVGLNGDQIEELAVDQLIDQLKHTDMMLQWLLHYIMDSIQEDKSWSNNDEKKTSFIREIKHFGKTIFRDYYKEHRNELNEKMTEEGFLEQYTTTLRQIREDAKERMLTIASSYFDTLEQEGFIVTDIKGGTRGVSGYFQKIKNGQFDPSVLNTTASKAMDAPENWYKKDHPRAEELHILADQVLIPMLRYTEEEREKQWNLYQSAQLTLRHLNNLRLLHSIEQKVKDLHEEANIFLLGNTHHLLHALIQDQDSPFIFEKIGAQLRHVMIDEFQDTSTVQWQNFKVLMRECMSHAGSENLIVGDVKQSVYRWRSGDWRLLNNIDQQFSSEMMEIRPLQTNYRSERNIIAFNNAFFTAAARQEQEDLSERDPVGAQQLKDAYTDVCQQIPDHRESYGYVEIRLLPATNYRERTLEQLTETVGTLIEQGISPDKMAILVRTNDNITLIADYFAQQMPEINIVSDEAFRLDASVSVRLLIDALRLLTHPADLLTKAQLVKTYHREVLGEDSSDSFLLLRNINPDDLLPASYIAHFDKLLMLPLYELVERLYAIFELHRLKDQSAYICAFYDCLTEFTMENSTGIDAFIETWELELHQKTIQSDELHGIRILTIHKSKGLEYDHVLLPFCDWQMERGETIWCEPSEEPFCELPVAPIDYSSKMLGTIYEKDYLNEHLQLTVDNLNLLYVAFTRACKNLFVIGKRKAKAYRSAIIEKVLPELELDGMVLEGVEDEQAAIFFSYGTLCVHQEKQQQHTENVFLQPSGQLSLEIETFDSKTEFRQSNKSQQFVQANEEEEDQQQGYVKMGSILHHVFSTIRTVADIDVALRQLEQEGILYDDEITAAKVSSMLRKRLESPRVKEWFSDKWTLYNECSILYTDADGHVCERRPDRVMSDGQRLVVVDFKFGHPRPEYQEQVREYMTLLQQMGHHQVEGYIWYVYSNQIESVK